MRRRVAGSARHSGFRVALVAGLIAAAWVTSAAAQFPGEDPDDPLYPSRTCVPPTDPACRGPNGQWNLFSFNPVTQVINHASGISADLAWGVTTGRPDVVIAVLDSGVNYDHEDLSNKIWLNRGELPVPNGACSAPASDPHDCNDDGVFNVADYEGDSRVAPAFNEIAGVQRGDLRVFADGLDDDSNGFIDDLSGWDADDDDGDEFDHRFFGHGTGRNGILAPETANGMGVAGICPDCPLMNVRIDDIFVHTSEGVAKGAIYAVDNGARVMNMSLGGTTASRLSRSAFDYATANNVLAVNAAANEFSTHQNFQSIFDDVMSVGAVTADEREFTTTWLQKANFSNYGAHTDLVAPSLVPGASQGCCPLLPENSRYTETASGTSSSTPHVAGVAGLVISRASDLIESGDLDPTGLALKEISAQEVRQILNRTAEDITLTNATPVSGLGYPVSDGWDRWTGYGRLNAKDAVDAVSATTIPPEADINTPDWYTGVDGVVEVGYYANARWTSSYGFTLEVGAGVEPSSFSPLAEASGVPSDPALSSASLANNHSALWDTSALPEGLYTLRLAVTDDLGNYGEDRMALWVRHDDPQSLPGFPRRLSGSLESASVPLVDLDGDSKLEIVLVGANGEVHALASDGTEAPGFPVNTDLPAGLPLASSPAFDGDPANGEVELSFSSVVGGATVGDLDRDGYPEIVVAASNGRLYCWHHSAEVCDGFPVASDPGLSRDPYGAHVLTPNNHPENIGITPALGDLDGDGDLEIVNGSLDQKLYVWHHDGTRMAPFPIVLSDSPTGPSSFNPLAIIASPALGDLDGDGALEIVVGTNEVFSSPAPPGTGGSGRIYMVEADGTIPAGWPVKPTSLSPSAVPLVAEGAPNSPVIADVDGSGTLEAIGTVFFGDAAAYDSSGTAVVTYAGAFGASGPGALDFDETTAEGGLASTSDEPAHFYVGQGAFGDLEGDGLPDYVAPTVGNRLAGIALGSGRRVIFDHLIHAWDATTGSPKPAFPRVMEDWQFFNGPAIADLDGDGLSEIVESSGGFFVHAFNPAGLEPEGWPKNTGGWQVSTPSVGDLDADGDLEVVQATRLGDLFVWSMPGDACGRVDWRKFSGNEWNSGRYGADTLPPSSVSDLSFTRDGDVVTLAWTATGDDGSCGTAAAYDLRFSDKPITPDNFDAAIAVSTGPPSASGAEDTLEVAKKDSCGSTYVALKVLDAAPGSETPSDPVNASMISNVVRITGKCIYLIPDGISRRVGLPMTFFAATVDDTGEPLEADVTFTVSGTGGETPVSQTVTSNSGLSRFTFTSTRAGVSKVTATTSFGSASSTQIWTCPTNVRPGGFMATDSRLRGGVHIASGDVNGDGCPEVIVGVPGGPYRASSDSVFYLPAELHVLTTEGVLLSKVLPYPGFYGDITVGAGDIDGDGLDEVVTAAGSGGGPHVKVWDFGPAPSEKFGFMAYSSSFRGGVYVAVGDLDLDGHDDLITGAGAGGGPHVKAFDGASLSAGKVKVEKSFFAYNSGFRGGVRVGAQDITGSEAADIITAPGPGGGPHVIVWDSGTDLAASQFMAYDPSFRGGVYVSGAGKGRILTGPGSGGGPHVKVFEGSKVIQSFMAYNVGFRGGIRVTDYDLDRDGDIDLLTAAGPGGGPHIRFFLSDEA